MKSAKYVGRVGGLAVALGVGAAIATGQGVASATPAGADTGKTTNNASQHEPGGGTRADAGSRSLRPKGPLAKIADRVRKSLQDSANDTLKRSGLAGVKKDDDLAGDSPAEDDPADDNLADDDPADGQELDDLAAAPDPAPEPERDVTDPDSKSGASAPLRSVVDNVVGQDSRRGDGKLDISSSEPVSASPDPIPVQRTTVIDVTPREAAEPVTERDSETPASMETSFTAPVEGIAAAAPTTLLAADDKTVVPTVDGLTEPVASAAPNLVSGFLAAVGLAPLAGTTPLAPAQPPGLWALLAWARREYERIVNPSGTAGSVVNATPTAVLLAEEAAPTSALLVENVTPTAAVPTFDPNAGLTPKPDAPNLTADDTTGMQWVTGGTPTNGNQTNTGSGNPGGYGIAGTDVGTMLDDRSGHVLILFGDTFDGPNMTGVWRSNVLLRSTDDNLSDGKLTIDDGLYSDGGVYGPTTNGWSNLFGATQAIRSPGYLGLFGSTTTLIPTAGISIPQTDADGNAVIDPETGEQKVTQYATVMSVRTWDNPGSWTTNWSAIAVSEDGGKTWTVDPDTIRSSGWLRSSTRYVPGNNHFQQNALVMSPDEDDPYVYVYGTPSGRSGSAYLARVPKEEITNLDAYEYWAGEQNGQGNWVANDPSAAVPVIGATDQTPPSGFIGWITKAINDCLGGFIVGGYEGGNVSEMSVQYNPYIEKYVVMYTDGGNNVVMRVSESPQGEWSDATVVVANDPSTTNQGTGEPNSGMYAPMIHPWSGTGQLKNADGTADVSNLYWNLSYWGPYNVSLMQTDLTPLRDQYVGNTVTV